MIKLRNQKKIIIKLLYSIVILTFVIIFWNIIVSSNLGGYFIFFGFSLYLITSFSVFNSIIILIFVLYLLYNYFGRKGYQSYKKRKFPKLIFILFLLILPQLFQIHSATAALPVLHQDMEVHFP